jgi:hypothetical protein
MRNAYKMSVSKLERRKTQGRPRYRWDNNIKMEVYHTDIGYESMKWIHLSQNSCGHGMNIEDLRKDGIILIR